LSAGTEFRVASFAATQIAAKNDAAISGGSSRQVKAVTKDDMNKLRSALTDTLKARAKNELQQQADDTQTLIAESVVVETVSEDFSNKLDEAADNLSLTIKVRAKGLAVKKSDLENIVSEQLDPEIPDGYSSVSSQEQSMEVVKTGADSVQFSVKILARVLPEYNTDEIITNIAGKSPPRANDYLKSLPEVTEVEIAITPRLPTFVTIIPRVTKHIEVVIQDAK
jgi:hypothetical protein